MGSAVGTAVERTFMGDGMKGGAVKHLVRWGLVFCGTSPVVPCRMPEEGQGGVSRVKKMFPVAM